MRNGEKVMKFWQTSYIHKNKSKLIIILLAILLVVGLFLGIMCGSIVIEPNEIYNIYDNNWNYENLMFEWAQNHDYNNVIICEDGRICFRN